MKVLKKTEVNYDAEEDQFEGDIYKHGEKFFWASE